MRYSKYVSHHAHRALAVDVARERGLRDELEAELRADADERRGPLRRGAADRPLAGKFSKIDSTAAEATPRAARARRRALRDV